MVNDYYVKTEKNSEQVFFAFPFTGFMQNGKLDKKVEVLLKEIRQVVIKMGYKVFLAHYREKWGKDLMCADECTVDDYREMKLSDYIIAFPGKPISGGVHIELGWASSMKKNILLMLDKNEKYSPLVQGLKTLTNVKICYYKNLNDKDVIDNIQSYLSFVDKDIINCNNEIFEENKYDWNNC